MQNYTHVETFDDGEILYRLDLEDYYSFHRLDGPAYIRHQINLDLGRTHQYFVRGERLTEEEWNNHPEVVAYKNEQLIKEALGL